MSTAGKSATLLHDVSTVH